MVSFFVDISHRKKLIVLETLGNTTANIEERLVAPDFTEERSSQYAFSALSRAERMRQLERSFHSLYRWYVGRSQRLRNWNPDTDFDWTTMRQDHSPDAIQLIEGFFAVEQFAPDYTTKIINVVRRSYGRTQFQLRWGGEEERHGESWENALLFSRGRTPAQIEDYKHALRENEWNLPWDDALHMLIYTVFQERATQLNYLNFAKIARGVGEVPGYESDKDPVLERVCTALATDEAAHYLFFLEGARLYLYYFPEDTLEAIHDVVKYFSMPAQGIIPNWDVIADTIYRTGVYGPREFPKNVLAPVFKNLGVTSRRALENGIKDCRRVPGFDGAMRDTALWSAFDPDAILTTVTRLYNKLADYERGIGRYEIDPLEFLPNPEWPEYHEAEALITEE